MTLIVTLRVPDGIVIAGDSYQTTIRTLQFQGEIAINCEHCGRETRKKDFMGPPLAVPSSSLSNAQKVFPVTNKVGIGTFGVGIVNSKSIYYLVRHFREERRNSWQSEPPLNEVANEVADAIHTELKKEVGDTSVIPETANLLGMLFVGFDDVGRPCTYEAKIGRESRVELLSTEAGISIAGDKGIAVALLEQLRQSSGLHFESFSLQDAIDLADLLINATATAQRFGTSLPTVGGKVDIALVTEYSGFIWVRRKEMTRILEGPEYEHQHE